MSKSFRTRKIGTPKQVGKKFPVIEKKILPPKIRITGAAREKVPTFIWEKTSMSFDEAHSVSAKELSPHQIPDEIANAVGVPKEKLTAFRGVKNGNPVISVMQNGNVLGFFVRKMRPKTKEEQKAARKAFQKQREDPWFTQYEKDMKAALKEKFRKTLKKVALVARPKKWYKDPVTGKWKKIKTTPELIARRTGISVKKAEKLMEPKTKAKVQISGVKGRMIGRPPKSIKKQIAKKVAAVKYPAAGRGPSYQKYLQKLKRRSKWKKRAKKTAKK